MAAPSEKVRLYARVGAALIAARHNEQEAFDAITAVIPWDRFLASVEEAEALARSEEFDAYQMSTPADVVGWMRLRSAGRTTRSTCSTD